MIAFITDTHLQPSTIDKNISVFFQLIDYCKENGIKSVIHGGDAFTNRAGQGLVVLNTFLEIRRMFEESGIHFIAVPGNHDKVDLDSEESYFDIDIQIK